MRLHVIGEHLARIRQIDEDRFNTASDPTWYKVIGLRNIISHGYETIDHEVIWHIISEDLAVFAASLTAIPPE